MFLEPSILSIALAKLRGGKFKRLEDVHIKGWYFLILSLVLQLGLSILKFSNLSFANAIINDYFFYLHLISYLLLILGISLNIKKLSMKVFLIGLLLNFLVIFSNGGKMPVSVDGIGGMNNTSIEIKSYDIKHIAMTDSTKIPYLADIIAIPPPYPLPKIISIGDIFLMLGLYIFFQEAMVRKRMFY